MTIGMTEQRTPFASMGYEPVGPVVNRLLARYLRTQRKNMRRFFQERGLHQFALRMDSIRKSNQTMLEKNRRFQKVLDAYAALATQAESPKVIAGETENP